MSTERLYNMLAITATNLPRFMICNGSRLMGACPTPINTDMTVRDEGVAAHWVAEQVHSGKFTAVELIDRKAPNGVYVTVEMVDYLEEYLHAITTPYCETYCEIDTSFGDNNSWRINGRADNIIYNSVDNTLYVNDFKYGWGIVEPANNWTLMAHAVGFVLNNPNTYVERICFTVFQPRPYHSGGSVRTWTITNDELKKKYIEIVEAITQPTDDVVTSKHCYKCPSFAICPAARNAQMNAIEASETAFNENIDNKNLSVQMDHLKRAIEILKQAQDAYKDLAVNRLQQGEIIENYSLEHQLAKTSWCENMTPEIVKTLTGVDVTEVKRISPSKAIKAGISKEVMSTMTERLNTGVKLVKCDIHTKSKKLFNQPRKGQ